MANIVYIATSLDGYIAKKDGDTNWLHEIPVIEGVSVSIKFAEAFVDLGLMTSKKFGYAKPRSKEYSGIFKQFQP